MTKPKPHEPHATPAADAKPADAGAEQLAQELQQLKDQHLRLLADVENTKKRLQRERDEFVKYAGEGMVRGLLPIIDSLDQALVAVDPSTRPAAVGLARDSAPAGLRKQPEMEAVVQGVQLIHKQLLKLLEKEGVKRITTVGEPFDPHVHEAVEQVEIDDGTPEHTIVEEVHVGYTMNGKVIRPALVKVAKRATEQQSSELGSGLRAEGSGQLPRAQNPEPPAKQ